MLIKTPPKVSRCFKIGWLSSSNALLQATSSMLVPRVLAPEVKRLMTDPDKFCCPLSSELMDDPVVAGPGFSLCFTGCLELPVVSNFWIYSRTIFIHLPYTIQKSTNLSWTDTKTYKIAWFIQKPDRRRSHLWEELDPRSPGGQRYKSHDAATDQHPSASISDCQMGWEKEKAMRRWWSSPVLITRIY